MINMPSLATTLPPAAAHHKLVFTDETNANKKNILMHTSLKHFVLLFDMENNTKKQMASRERCLHYLYINQSEINLFSSLTFMIIAPAATYIGGT